MLGTAGTGKTLALKTALQALADRGLLRDFVRVAAPTGTAAFNVGFNATTIHRLIHWFHPNFFAEISNDEHLAKLQAHFENTQMFVFDEVSMIGRKMTGRIDSRTQQAVADRNCNDESLGGMSLVCIGDPAQCQALFDQQMYDLDPHEKTKTYPLQQDVRL